MKDFLMSALPFIIIAISLAIICVNLKKGKKAHKKDDNTYLIEGMCLGMCLGVTLSSTMNFDISLGTSLGMLIGEAIGISVKKK